MNGADKQTKVVAIQGRRGAFHEIAAREAFEAEELRLFATSSFDELVRAVESGRADAGVMAIENTLAGSIMDNYRLLRQSDLCIVGEVYLHISQNLMGLPGQRLDDLSEVHSHPMALAQCRAFFADHPHIRLVESEDTAYSAMLIAKEKIRGRGALASLLAAKRYGLEVLAAGIETHKENHTRFLILEPLEACGWHTEGADKASLSFALPHLTGSLHGVLAVLAAYGFNLTKIQSAPIPGRPWEYLFFVDFVHEEGPGFEFVLDVLRPITRDLKVLGIYRRGVKKDANQIAIYKTGSL